MLACERRRGASGKIVRVGYVVCSLFVKVFISQTCGVHARVGNKQAFEAIKDDEKRLVIKGGQKFLFALGERYLLEFFSGALCHVGERADKAPQRRSPK